MCCRGCRDWCMALRLRCQFSLEHLCSCCVRCCPENVSGACEECWEEDGCLRNIGQLIFGFFCIPIAIVFMVCYFLYHMARDVGARTAFCRGFERPLWTFFAISLSTLLNSMLADGYSFLDFPGSRVVCYVPVFVLNLEFTVLFVLCPFCE